MRHTPRARLVGLATALTVATLAAPGAPASAEPGSGSQPATNGARSVAPDIRELPPDDKISLDRSSVRAMRKQLNRAVAADDAEVGDVKTFVALDDISGQAYLKDYRLRGIGEHIEVWVPEDTTFPEGDCRNELGLTAITDEQVNSFVEEFDSNIYPKESAAFSVPPSLDGSEAVLPEFVGLPPDYYEVGEDQADNIVTLIDNVRDANFFDPGTPDGQTYIAGFFSGTFNDFIGRNVMTIDAFDWLHRTGATPPDDSADPAYVACTEELGLIRPLGQSFPHRYEGIFAHEYQHLLEHYEDVDEVNWINEGLSDYAQTLVGYVDPTIPPDDPAADSHLSCFAGFLGEAFGGPENSLTQWQDQGGPEILCDYGATYSMMMYLFSKYGGDFLTALHREDANGIPGLDAVLDQFGSRKSGQETIHDWAAMVALDTAVERGRRLIGAKPWWYTAKALTSFVNWDSPQAYDSPGAPPNGSDYVRLRRSDAASDKHHSPYLRAKELRWIKFEGAATLEPDPLEWVVDATPPDATTAETTCGAIGPGGGPAAIYSGCGENLDRSIVREVTVPAGGGQLTFDTLYDTEEQWDFGYVQVSTDGGATWTSLGTEDTTDVHDPAADPAVIANLPGFSGDSGGWTTQHADLSAFAGQTVLVGFRYITDGAVDEAGFWVRNVDLAGTTLPTDTLDGWQSITQANPIEVSGWTVQLITIGKHGVSRIHRMHLNSSFRGFLSAKEIRRALGTRADLVAALVMMDDPSETAPKNGRYELVVNGVLQPGG